MKVTRWQGLLLLVLFGLAPRVGLAQESYDGSVVLSDGETHQGSLSLGRGKRISLYETELKRRLTIELGEVRHILFEVESEEMKQAWMFKEESSPEKLKLPYYYPIRKLLAKLTLTSGQVVQGHVTALSLTLRGEGGKQRFILATHQKGKKDQTLEDLLYVKEVVLGEPPAAGQEETPTRTATLQGRAGGAREVVVIDRDRRARCPGTVEGGRYAVAELLPGPVRVFAWSEDRLLAGMPAQEEERLTAEEREDLNGFLLRVEEFFNEKDILLISGTKEELWLLIESRRTRPSHLKDEETGEPILTIRWDLWIVRFGEADWELKTRLYLFRRPIMPGERFPEPKAEARPELTDVIIGEEGGIHELDLDR